MGKPTADAVCTDVGYKAIASDPVGDRGLFLNIDDAGVGLQNEERWVVATSRSDDLSIGDAVYVVPWHIRPTGRCTTSPGIQDEISLPA